MLTDDLIEMKSDIKYIKDVLDRLENEVAPIKTDYDRVRGGLYVAVICGGIVLSACSYFVHNKIVDINDRIASTQQQLALINASTLHVAVK